MNQCTGYTQRAPRTRMLYFAVLHQGKSQQEQPLNPKSIPHAHHTNSSQPDDKRNNDWQTTDKAGGRRCKRQLEHIFHRNSGQYLVPFISRTNRILLIVTLRTSGNFNDQ